MFGRREDTSGKSIAYMDKMAVLVSGDITNVAVLVQAGETRIDLTQISSLTTKNTTPTPDIMYVSIPFQCDSVTVTATTVSEDTNISFYGGSA